MKRIKISKSFNYAYEGYRVVTHDPGTLVVIDRVAEVGVEDKCAKVIPVDKQNLDELKELLQATYPKAEIPEGIKKGELIEWLESGTMPLFDQGEIPLEDQDLDQLVETAKEKYPLVDIPEETTREKLIAFIGDGQPGWFVSVEDMQAMSLTEVTALSTNLYPGVVVSPKVQKDDLIIFIESGDESSLVETEDNKAPEDMDIEELLGTAKEKYPDVDIPQAISKESLIAFIESGDVVNLKIEEDKA